MRSKRLHSKSSATAPGKLSDEASGVVQIESLGVDSDTIEKLTVQQLREKLRCAGIPAKGSKKELVSNWKNYLDVQKDGRSSLGLEDQAFSDKKPEGLPIAVDGPSMNNVSEVPRAKKLNRRVKEGSGGNKKADTETIQFNITQEQSIEYLEVPGKRLFRAKKNVSSEVCTGYGASEAVVEPWTFLAHKRPQKGWVAYNPRIMRPPLLTRDTKHLKLMSWNVNGLRALLKLESFSALELAKREDFDVLCLQETKLQEKDVEAVKQGLIEGYNNSFWTCSVSKLGYSGTAVISRVEPLSVRYGLGIPDHDTEGRLVTVEFDSFYLLTGYVPNSGDGLRRLEYRITQWDPSLGNYMKELEKSKPVILTGDLNCAHEEIDIYNPAGNRRSAGFTDEERESFETNFLTRGFVDTFRRQHPGVVGYTYWGYRHGGRKTNKGWRLDYFLVSEAIADNVHDSYILPDVTGSDHSPIGLILKV